MAIPEKADGVTGWGGDYRAIVRRVNALTNDSTGKIPVGQLATGTPSAGVFVRGDGQFAPPQLWADWQDVPWASSLTLNAAGGVKWKVNATGDFTLQEPASGGNGQPLWLRVTAVSAQRVVTFASVIIRPSFIPSTLTIPSGARGDIAMVNETGYGWKILSAAA